MLSNMERLDCYVNVLCQTATQQRERILLIYIYTIYIYIKFRQFDLSKSHPPSIIVFSIIVLTVSKRCISLYLA